MLQLNRLQFVGIDTHALAGWLAGMVTAQTLSALAFLIASAAVLRAVSVAYLGGTPDWRDSLRAATSRLRSLIWLALLLAGGLGLSAVALFFPFIWLGVSWSIAFPILIAEGERGTGALRRSFRLVRGRWWPTAGALALAFMFQFFLGLVLGIPLGLLSASWDSGSAAAIAVTSVVSVISSVITTPFMAAVLVLIYFDLRVRKEGFDLELLSQGVGIPGAALPARGPWVTPGAWVGPSGNWPAPGGAWPERGGWSGSGAPGGSWPAPSGSWPAPSGAPPYQSGGPPPQGGSWPGSGGGPPPSELAEPAQRETGAPSNTGWGGPIDPTGGWGPPPDEPTEDKPDEEPLPGEGPPPGGSGEPS